MPQKQSFSPIITGAVSIKNSPPKVGVNITNYQAFKCPKCHANISFNGQDIDGNLMKFQKHVIAHFQDSLFSDVPFLPTYICPHGGPRYKHFKNILPFQKMNPIPLINEHNGNGTNLREKNVS